jgi:hypothetical protein
MGSMLCIGMAHPAEGNLGVVDFRSTVVSRGFSALAVVTQDLLSGFERPSRAQKGWLAL